MQRPKSAVVAVTTLLSLTAELSFLLDKRACISLSSSTRYVEKCLTLERLSDKAIFFAIISDTFITKLGTNFDSGLYHHRDYGVFELSFGDKAEVVATGKAGIFS